MFQLSRRVAIGVLVCCLLTAGCMGAPTGGDSAEPETELTGEYSDSAFDDLLESATATQENRESFSFDMAMSMDMDGQSVEMESTGKADVTAQEMTMALEMDGPGIAGLSELEMYVDGEEAYVNAGDGWVTVPADQMDQNTWDVEGQAAVTEAQYEYGDVHVEEGDDVVTVTTTLDSTGMANFIEAAESAEMPAADASDLEWNDVEVVDRFDADTHTLRSTEMSADVTMNGETAAYHFEMSIDDVDEELDTAVPDEVVEEAESGSGLTV